MTAWLWPLAPGTVFLESGIECHIFCSPMIPGEIRVTAYSCEEKKKTNPLPSICRWSFSMEVTIYKKQRSISCSLLKLLWHKWWSEKQSRLSSLSVVKGQGIHWVVVLTWTDSCLCSLFFCRLECTLYSRQPFVFAILRTTIELCIYKKCHIFKVLSWKTRKGLW